MNLSKIPCKTVAALGFYLPVTSMVLHIYFVCVVYHACGKLNCYYSVMSTVLKDKNRKKTLMKPWNILLKHSEKSLRILQQKYMCNPSLHSVCIGLHIPFVTFCLWNQF